MLHQSIRPELITEVSLLCIGVPPEDGPQPGLYAPLRCNFLRYYYVNCVCQVELPGCSGIWTVYHKAERDDANEFDFGTNEIEEFHAYLIISLESKTMVCICAKRRLQYG